MTLLLLRLLLVEAAFVQASFQSPDVQALDVPACQQAHHRSEQTTCKCNTLGVYKNLTLDIGFVVDPEPLRSSEVEYEPYEEEDVEACDEEYCIPPRKEEDCPSSDCPSSEDGLNCPLYQSYVNVPSSSSSFHADGSDDSLP
jgi:hypothetical protein